MVVVLLMVALTVPKPLAYAKTGDWSTYLGNNARSGFIGTILLGSRLLPRVFGFLAFGLGIAFAIVGLIALFTTPILSIVVLSLQALWVLAAALTLLVRAGTASDTKGEASPGS